MSILKFKAMPNRNQPTKQNNQQHLCDSFDSGSHLLRSKSFQKSNRLSRHETLQESGSVRTGRYMKILQETHMKVRPWRPRERQIGDRIGQYKIVSKLGSGEFGDVYHARRVANGCEGVGGDEVALKIIRMNRENELIDENREVAAYHQAGHHVNLVRLLTTFEIPADEGELNELGLVLELIDGVDLSSVLDAATQITLPETTVICIAKQLCRALEKLHAQGVAHGDVTPRNIMLQRQAGKLEMENATVKLVDFGMAVRWDPSKRCIPKMGQSSEESTNNALYYGVGSTPESARFDVVRFGAVLHKMLCGLFPRPDVLCRLSIFDETEMGDMSVDMKSLLRKCIAKIPECFSAAEVLRELNRMSSKE